MIFFVFLTILLVVAANYKESYVESPESHPRCYTKCNLCFVWMRNDNIFPNDILNVKAVTDTAFDS